jgi:uncharacterized repeat protein (TIGR03806 family)
LRARITAATLVVALAACVKFGEDPPKVEVTKAPLLCKAPALREGKARVKNAFPGVTFEEPVRLVREGARWFVAERKGKIQVFDDRDDVSETRVFFDLAATGQLDLYSEYNGLLAMAFHPRFAENGEVFLAYTAPASALGALFEYRIDRVRSTDGGKTLDPSTLERVFAFSRDQATHHGGPLLFGNDGMLYAATGDGYYGDPQKNSQKMHSPRGKILRFDVDGARPYRVPADNPFVGNAEALPEIWALGFRNPYGMWLDRQKNDLWVGDVGQLRYEEIDVVTRGGNYGWSEREGRHCYAASRCDTDGLIDPVYEYDHGQGFCVTAGFVYRANAFPDRRESFVFADFITGRVSTLRDGQADVLVESGRLPSHIAESRTGEVLLLDYGTGTIQEVVPEDRTAIIPPTLSATGCFDPKDGRVADSLFPYDVRMELWSDGATKQRWLYVPEGQKIGMNLSGGWEAPAGSVVFKTFTLGDRKVETRMLVNHEEGGWTGYSYAWNEAQDDAVLLHDGETRTFGDGKTWTYPSRSDCFACHNLASGRTLGLNTAQMDRDGQIETLDSLGRFDELRTGPPISDGRDTDSIEAKARSYLAVNCGICHRGDGPASGLGDYRLEMSFASMQLCNARAQNAEGNTLRLVPGNPEASAIIQRMKANDGTRMPPLATNVVDERGVRWVSDWIKSLPPSVCARPSPIGP